MAFSRLIFRRLKRYAALDRADQALLLHALLRVALVRLALWTLPFLWVQRHALRAAERAAAHPVARSLDIATIVAAVDLAAEYVPGATCLTQALAAQLLLARVGRSSLLRIGVMRAESGQFKAHAWIECGGVIVLGGNIAGLSDFTALPTI